MHEIYDSLSVLEDVALKMAMMKSTAFLAIDAFQQECTDKSSPSYISNAEQIADVFTVALYGYADAEKALRTEIEKLSNRFGLKTAIND